LFLFCFLLSNDIFSESGQLYGASFGYKVKKFNPFVGIQIVNASLDIVETGFRNASNLGIEAYTDKYKVTGTAFAPTIGLKYFFSENEKVKTYGILSGTTVILSAKETDADYPQGNENLQKGIKDLHIYGGQLGFGAEYFFDPMFSVGGEFGIRMIYLKNTQTDKQSVYDPTEGDYVEKPQTLTYKASLNPTYAKMSLNFYFAGKKKTE